MRYKIDHSDEKDFSIKIIFGSFIISIILCGFTLFHINIHSEFESEYFLQATYFYITQVYILTYQQFIFATSGIKARFKLLNKNLM